MPNPAPSSKPAARRKVDPALQYRWGLVGVVLAIGFFAWYLFTSGSSRDPLKSGINQAQEKIVCPRCENDAERKLKCSLCGGLGYIWVNKEPEKTTSRTNRPR